MGAPRSNEHTNFACNSSTLRRCSGLKYDRERIWRGISTVPLSCHTRARLGALVLFFGVFALSASATAPGSAPVRVEELTRAIPARSLQDLTGSQFVRYVSNMDARDREQAILDEISKGNLPEFLRKLVPVKLQGQLATGKDLIATIFVTPDYLAIGSDADFLRIP